MIKTIKIFKSEAYDNENVLSYLRRIGYTIEAPCGGIGSCGKCLVRILEGEVQKPRGRELCILNLKGAEKNIRLACYIKIENDLVIQLLDDNRGKCTAQIVTDGGLSYAQKSNELINKSDFFSIDPIDELLPWRGGKISNYLGVALDIGTTTIVIYLMDLETGENKGVTSILNPQKIYGADVISRIQYANQSFSHLKKLQSILVDKINQAIDYLLIQGGWLPEELCRLVAIGNTTILHLLLGVSVKGLAAAPYEPAFLASQRVNAVELGYKAHPKAELFTIPCISAFAGADLVAAMQSCRMFDNREINLLVDIGTNGEMVIGHKGKFLACSTPAGPAFEGGSITWGCPALPGAIDHVKLSSDILSFDTIGNKKAIGICGSGLVDITAELLRNGILEPNGLLKSKTGSRREYIIDDRKNISINQMDIREIQLAKSAIHAGIESLIKAFSNNYEEIDNLWLAGGFSSYINLRNALRIGLLPRQMQGKINLTGNSAGQGACEALLSITIFNKLIELTNSGLVEYLDLATSEDFQRRFLRSLDFPNEVKVNK